MYDIIGDVHGHAGALVRLLETLEYDRRNGFYAHPHRRAVFVGDFVDRGPDIPGVLRIVRPMIDQGAALSVMGNHELNAIAYHTRGPDGRFLRPHSAKNLRQHWETLRQLSGSDLYDAIAWFRTLPRWLDLGGIRVVHACWHPPAMEALANESDPAEPLPDEFVARSVTEGDPVFEAVEVVLKGPEVWLPGDLRIPDKEQHHRRKVRVKWYEPPHGRTYRDYSFPENEACPDLPVEVPAGHAPEGYPPDAPPVFFGHYWLADEQPAPLAPNVACLDYSVARGGKLVAYRWDGEQSLSAEKFVSVPADAL